MPPTFKHQFKQLFTCENSLDACFKVPPAPCGSHSPRSPTHPSARPAPCTSTSDWLSWTQSPGLLHLQANPHGPSLRLTPTDPFWLVPGLDWPLQARPPGQLQVTSLPFLICKGMIVQNILFSDNLVVQPAAIYKDFRMVLGTGKCSINVDSYLSCM